MENKSVARSCRAVRRKIYTKGHGLRKEISVKIAKKSCLKTSDRQKEAFGQTRKDVKSDRELILSIAFCIFVCNPCAFGKINWNLQSLSTRHFNYLSCNHSCLLTCKEQNSFCYILWLN